MPANKVDEALKRHASAEGVCIDTVLLEQGLIEESRRRPAPDADDERRRYYLLTPFGSAVARAEARRLTQLVRLAKASGFAPGKA